MVITEIKQCVKNKNRVNIYADEEFVFALYIDTVLANKINTGAEISREQAVNILKEDEEKYALEIALNRISYKMYTKKEIIDKLKQKGLNEESIEYAIGKLKEYKYIDDEKYAQLYAEELSKKYGCRVIEQKLIQKGIPREIVKEYCNINDDEVLRAHIEKYESKYSNLDKRNRDYKIVNALMRKGFLYDDIKHMLNVEDDY